MPVTERGAHRIFLGYAAGVGKTYAMLVEARLRASRSEDVVVGFLDPRIRPDTRKLAEGLPIVPAQRVRYHGSEFAELDADAVIARHPEWVVVDELAHSEVEGTDHDKRWQSVDAILDAGIGVLSTLNVQHIASLNDYVYQVSGVRVTETVPDKLVDAAEVILVDTDPDELLERVRRGMVVPPEQVGQALMHFFRRATLHALRERALAVKHRTVTVAGGRRDNGMRGRS